MGDPAQARAARKALNARFGDSRFDDRAVQAELGFEKHGSTIVDRLFGSPLEYDYPSTLGTALFYDGAFESGEIALVDRLLSRVADPVVLDIGANIGVHTRAWATRHPGARVFAFEPTASTRAVLVRNVGRAGVTERVTILAEAVGAETRTATLYECEDGAYNSLAPRPHRSTGTSEIAVTTVDDIVRERGLTTLSVIKIDVEGLEHEVVAGAARTLRDRRPALLVEISRESGTAEETIARIVEFGYRAYRIVDGFAVPYDRYDDVFENHLFLDARVDPDLPAYPGTEFMLERTRHRTTLVASLEREVAALRAGRDAAAAARETLIAELTDEIAVLQTACDDRLRLLRSQEQDLVAQRGAATSREAAIDELTGENVRLSETCEKRARLLLAQAEELDRRDGALADELALSRALRDVCDERLLALENLATELRRQQTEAAAQISRFVGIATERGALLERTAQALRAERERSATLQAACDERLGVIERLSAAAGGAGASESTSGGDGGVDPLRDARDTRVALEGFGRDEEIEGVLEFDGEFDKKQ